MDYLEMAKIFGFEGSVMDFYGWEVKDSGLKLNPADILLKGGFDCATTEGAALLKAARFCDNRYSLDGLEVVAVEFLKAELEDIKGKRDAIYDFCRTNDLSGEESEYYDRQLRHMERQIWMLRNATKVNLIE